MATAPRTPQDHRPKAADVEPFTFEGTDADGDPVTFTLPPASKATLRGRALRDAVIDGETGMMGYMLRKLEAVASGPALDALYELPEPEMLDILKGWGEYGDGDGASLPQS